MMFLEIYNFYFSDYSYHDWMKGIKLGYLISFSQNEGIVLRDIYSLRVIFSESSYLKNKLYYYVFENELFFSIDNSLYKFNFENNIFEILCNTEEEYIWMISNCFALGSTHKRSPRVNNNEVIRVSNCSKVFKWADRSGLIYIDTNNFALFKNDFESILKAIDIEIGKELWSLKLEGFSAPRFYKNISEQLFLVMQSFDTDHPTDKRFELWGINKESGEIMYKTECANFDRFLFNEEDLRLYGVSGQQYLCVDPFTGEILSNKRIIELGEGANRQWAILGNQSMTEKDIYFTISGKPIVGRFNILSEKVEEFIDIPVDETKVDMRQPLNMPFFHANRLYVRDNSAVMHILEYQTV